MRGLSSEVYGLFICSLFQLSSGQTDHVGDEFMIAFPGTPKNIPKLRHDPEMDAWVLSATGGVVQIQARDMMGTYKIKVTGASITKLPLGPSWTDARMTPLTVEEKGVNVTSTSKMLLYVTYGPYTYLVPPSAMLEKDYYIVCAENTNGTLGSGRNRSSLCLFGIAAVRDNTVVNVTLANTASNGTIFTMNNVDYGPGDVMTVVMSSSQTLEITSDADLTGTRVQSDEPVAVVSGNVVWDADDVTDVVQEMVPAVAWGKQFFAVLPEMNGVKVAIKVVARNDNTTVVLKYDQKTLESSLGPGEQSTFGGVYLTPSDNIVLESSEPIMAVYYLLPSDENSTYQPSMTALIPRERYNSNYKVIINNGDKSRVIAVFVAGSSVAAGIMLNGRRLDGKSSSSSSWKPLTASGNESAEVVWTPLGGASVVYTQVALASTGTNQHESVHASGGTVSYGMFLYKIQNNALVEMPLNMRLIPLWDRCQPSTAAPDDSIDNDCDGAVDEERKDGIDNDNDGKIDEDFSKEEPHTEMSITSEVSITKSPPVSQSPPKSGNPKKSRLRGTFNNITYIIVGSVLIGGPLIVIAYVAIEAMVLTMVESRKRNKIKDNGKRKGGHEKKGAKPEVIPMFCVRGQYRDPPVATSSVDAERPVTPGMVEERRDTKSNNVRHVTYFE